MKTFTFDGQGINDDDEYKTQLAKLTKPGHDAKVGPLLASAPRLLAQLKRILAMHECGNNGMYNGEAVLSKSVADEIRYVIKGLGK